MDKLKLINIGDTIEYKQGAVLQRAQVQGFKLDLETRETRLLIGGEWHSSMVSLQSVTKRERLHGAGQGIVTF